MIEVFMYLFSAYSLICVIMLALMLYDWKKTFNSFNDFPIFLIFYMLFLSGINGFFSYVLYSVK